MPRTDGSGRTRRTKVGRLIETYDLGEEYGAELERSWVREGPDRKSLRELAAQFNHDILDAAMSDADMTVIEGEVENLYSLLTSDEVTAGVRTDAQRRLERGGVDVEQLERDFVSYQAIRSYLQNHRGATYEEPDDEDRVERTSESIQRLLSRLNSVCETNLEQLRESGRITLDEFQLIVTVDVLCENCGAQYTVTDLLERGGCDCPRPDLST